MIEKKLNQETEQLIIYLTVRLTKREQEKVILLKRRMCLNDNCLS